MVRHDLPDGRQHATGNQNAHGSGPALTSAAAEAMRRRLSPGLTAPSASPGLVVSGR
jgi:hypothetical protein